MANYDIPPHLNYEISETVKSFCSKSSDITGCLKSNTKIYSTEISDDGYYYYNNLFYGENNNKDYSYKINKNFYRTKNFEKLNSENYNILYTGCSFTFGTGLPEDLVWTNILENSIKKNNVFSYNISQSGASTVYLIYQVMSFIRKYGKPNLIVALFPEISRDLLFYHDNYNNILFRSEYLESKETKNYVLDYKHENNILKNSILISMLEDFCEAAEIKLIWSVTIREDYNVYKDLDFKCLSKEFINFNDSYREQSENFDNFNNMNYWGLAGDGQHPGSCFHVMLAESFRKQLYEIN